MSTEKPIEKDEKKTAKKAIKKQVKRIVKAYGDEKALAIMTGIVEQATAEKQAAATKA